jgi:hypothetical protein
MARVEAAEARVRSQNLLLEAKTKALDEKAEEAAAAKAKYKKLKKRFFFFFFTNCTHLVLELCREAWALSRRHQGTHTHIHSARAHTHTRKFVFRLSPKPLLKRRR